MAEPQYSADEMMTVAAARMLRDRVVCFVGIGLPSAAANLARLTHAPDAVLIYESGTIGAKPSVLPLSIGDGELGATLGVARAGCLCYFSRQATCDSPERRNLVPSKCRTSS